jgi:hypothetical protein
VDRVATIVAEPATSIPDVIQKMTDISAALPESDGVAAFNSMYLTVTKAVGGAIEQGFFANSEFLDRLDVVFANLYFDALRLIGAGERAPRCWSVLVHHRTSSHVHPVQFALAGMNAHINHDLVLAVVTTLDEFGIEPDPPRHEDYTRVNDLLASLEADIRRSFEIGMSAVFEERWGPIEDRFACWSISAARAAAWLDAEALWHVHLRARARYLAVLDDAVALAAECLLAPTRLHHEEAHPCCRHESIFAPRMHRLEAELLQHG